MSRCQWSLSCIDDMAPGAGHYQARLRLAALCYAKLQARHAENGLIIRAGPGLARLGPA
jgi:hypothetical protein